MWKARGTKALTNSVDQAMSSKDYFLKRIKNIAGFRLVLPNYECTSVCFWWVSARYHVLSQNTSIIHCQTMCRYRYIPPSMRGQEETQDWWDKLYIATCKIKERMIMEGSLVIGYMPLLAKNMGNFFRMVICCQPPPTESSMDYAINQIEKLALDLRISDL